MTAFVVVVAVVDTASVVVCCVFREERVQQHVLLFPLAACPLQERVQF